MLEKSPRSRLVLLWPAFLSANSSRGMSIDLNFPTSAGSGARARRTARALGSGAARRDALCVCVLGAQRARIRVRVVEPRLVGRDLLVVRQRRHLRLDHDVA